MYKVYFWIAPAKAKKYHIHAGDGRSLCGSWLMANKAQMVKDGDVLTDSDCLKCWNRMVEERNGDHDD